MSIEYVRRYLRLICSKRQRKCWLVHLLAWSHDWGLRIWELQTVFLFRCCLKRLILWSCDGSYTLVDLRVEKLRLKDGELRIVWRQLRRCTSSWIIMLLSWWLGTCMISTLSSSEISTCWMEVRACHDLTLTFAWYLLTLLRKYLVGILSANKRASCGGPSCSDEWGLQRRLDWCNELARGCLSEKLLKLRTLLGKLLNCMGSIDYMCQLLVLREWLHHRHALSCKASSYCASMTRFLLFLWKFSFFNGLRSGTQFEVFMEHLLLPSLSKKSEWRLANWNTID